MTLRLQYKKKHRIRGAILSHQQSHCYLWTHSRCTSAIKFINQGVSCFIQEHLRWRNHPWFLAYQSPYFYSFWINEVQAFIWNDFRPNQTSQADSSAHQTHKNHPMQCNTPTRPTRPIKPALELRWFSRSFTIVNLILKKLIPNPHG